MCNYVLFWISYLLSALQWIWILKRFFVTHGLGPGKPGPRAAKPIIPPYVENNYRIEVKITFMLIAYLVLLCEFIWEFSIFHSCRPLVDIYWHPLLSRRFLNQNYPKYTSNVVSKILEKNKTQLSDVLSEFAIFLKLGFLWWEFKVFICFTEPILADF